MSRTGRNGMNRTSYEKNVKRSKGGVKFKQGKSNEKWAKSKSGRDVDGAERRYL